MARVIAIVEDEPSIRANYRDAFSKQGYNVDLYSDRPTALSGFTRRTPDLAIIDIGLEHEVEGGFDLCRELRQQHPHLPIIFLTARDSDFDVISGLRLGADDYLTKDISIPQLSARVSALLRRYDSLQTPLEKSEALIRGDLQIDKDRMTLNWQQQKVDLTVTEFWIIFALANHPGHVKHRQQLMEAANVVLDDNTITSHIKRIRKKFQSIDADFRAIQTVYGAGYRWNE